jgi:protocatechuate 3,4-dioxygenase beta subunit
MTRAVPLLILVAGCLPDVGGAALPPECHQDSDCPVSGQVCDENVCWGDPPPGTYAALIGPPASNRNDLVVTELPELTIPFDGGFGDLIIQAPVKIGGRVHLGCQAIAGACDASQAIAATVTVQRPSRIHGGPQYVDSTTSDDTVTSGDTFVVDVPRLALDDMPYTVTITPDDTKPITPGGPTAAQLAPPLTTQVHATDDMLGLDLALGQGALRTVTGRITDATGNGVANVRVSAYGRFAASRPLERVSTVAVTDGGGNFALYITPTALTIVDIVAHPADAPGLTLRLHDFAADQATQTVGELRLPAAGKPIGVMLPVIGHNGAGVATPVAGASVDLTTSLNDPLHPLQVATFEVTTSTDAHGNANLMLIPASGTTLREYDVRINPAPTSEFASVYGQKIEVGTSGGVLGAIDLPHRVAVTGSLVDADGNPVEGVTVTAQPALRIALTLDAATQAILSSLQPPTATTKADGSFFVWVDPDLDGAAPLYDLDCVPPAGARTPRWTFHDVMLKNATDNVVMGAQALPRGRHVRGRVVDEYGAPVTGSEVRLYQIVTDASLCMASNMPADCTLPAALRSVDRSDGDGVVRLVLPDPRP